jgi:hypothetical protein
MRFIAWMKELGLSGWGTIVGILVGVATLVAFLWPVIHPDPGPDPVTKDAPARDVAKAYVEDFFGGKWGDIWDDLDPGEQELIGRDEFVACHAGQSTAELKSQEVAGVRTGKSLGDVVGLDTTNPAYPQLDLETGPTVVTVNAEVKTSHGLEDCPRRGMDGLDGCRLQTPVPS